VQTNRAEKSRAEKNRAPVAFTLDLTDRLVAEVAVAGRLARLLEVEAAEVAEPSL
jgi:hypothetical protein